MASSAAATQVASLVNNVENAVNYDEITLTEVREGVVHPSTENDGTQVGVTTVGNRKKKKVPRKILHFSDGILEEYSTDEDEPTPEPQTTVNPKLLPWGSWIWYYIATAAGNTLAAADMCGEKLAWMFGITSPKYQYELDEYHRIKHHEEEDRKEEEQQREYEEKMKLTSAEEGMTDVPGVAIENPLPGEKY